VLLTANAAGVQPGSVLSSRNRYRASTEMAACISSHLAGEFVPGSMEGRFHQVIGFDYFAAVPAVISWPNRCWRDPRKLRLR
jgi:hypothetical protein